MRAGLSRLLIEVTLQSPPSLVQTPVGLGIQRAGKASLARRHKIVEYFEKAIAREGESAILYDYLPAKW